MAGPQFAKSAAAGAVPGVVLFFGLMLVYQQTQDLLLMGILCTAVSLAGTILGLWRHRRKSATRH